MKRALIISFAALLLCLGNYSHAGIGPTLGLPTVTVSNNNNSMKWNPDAALTNTAVTMNNGSVMCVDCHTRNPSPYAPPSSFPGGTYSLNFVGSHFVTNTFADTNTGGGYAGAVSNVRAANDYYVKRDAAWTTTSRMSKYGRIVSGSLVSDNSTGGGATGRQIICESCHSITRNFGKYKLLATVDNVYLSGDSNICSGCHADMRMGVNNEPSFFDNTTPGNHHHRNYQPTTLYGGAAGLGTHDAKLISVTAGYYGPPSKLWAASYGQLSSLPRNAVYTSSTNPGIKNVSSATDFGMIHVDNSASLYCLSCHRAHNAVSSTTGLILKTGSPSDNSAYSWGGSTIPTSKNTTSGNTWQAQRRQSEFGDPSNYNNRIIKDDRPLCNGCHQNR